MNKLNINKIGLVLGIISVVFFLICSVYGWLSTAVELQTLHYQLLQLMYPGFAFTVSGYIIGVVEAFVYGWLTGVLFTWLCKKMCVTSCKHCK